MTTANRSAIPSSVANGLRLFWIAWAVSVALGLYLELRPIYDALQVLNANKPFQAGAITGLALAVPLAMLTPRFIGSSVAAVMLILVARRKSWSRWALLAGMVATGVALAASFRSTLVQESSSSAFWILAVRGVMYLTMILATIKFFSDEASMWFKSKETGSKKEAPQQDVA